MAETLTCSKCGDFVVQMVDAFGAVMTLSTRTGYEYTCPAGGSHAIASACNA